MAYFITIAMLLRYVAVAELWPYRFRTGREEWVRG